MRKFSMLSSQRRKDIDLNALEVDDLRALVAKIERELSVRQFEEGLRRALHDYQRRDPNVIHL
jgi:hypothetical protein